MAVVPRKLSLVFTWAPWSSRTFTAATLPLRAAIIRAVSPCERMGAFTSAPAFNSFSIMAALPFCEARNSGVALSRLAAFTSAPARINRSAISRSSHRATQWSAVVPSACDAVTSAFLSTSARRPSRLFFMAASAASLPAPKQATDSNPAMPIIRMRHRSLAVAARSAATCRPGFDTEPRTSVSGFGVLFSIVLERHRARAIAEACLFDAEHVQGGQQKIRGRTLGPDMTAALVLPHGPAHQQVTHVLVAMQIRVAHVAGPQDQRMVEQRSVAVRRGFQLGQEIRQA